MSKRLWCENCATYVDRPEYQDGKICCSFCGRVVCEDNWSEEVTFAKDSSGQSRAQGTLNRFASSSSDSRKRTLDQAHTNMQSMFLSVCNDDNSEFVLAPAKCFYEIAVERNFTRGRERDLVEAACLYLACRTKNKPYLLIDFAEYLNRNIYEIGAVYLQLCKLLSLVEHEYVQKPVDPSLFIHRFSHRLLGEKDEIVTRTALKIIASMKRDWIQTGRKPSGLCGAALYISALSHGYKYTKSDIVRIVHICEATLTKRLIEFENTKSGSLTIKEFTEKAEELEIERRSNKWPAIGLKVSEGSEVLCEHKDEIGIRAFAHGLCVRCYEEFVALSGGLDGGSEPPAFQRAEQERMARANVEENAEDSSHDNYLNSGKKLDVLEASRDEDAHFTEGDTIGAIDDISFGTLHGVDDKACEESETLSDIDDLEVDGYIHNKEEQRYKQMIWEELNRDYEEEQAAKKAATEVAREAYLRNCPEGMEDAQKLAADAAAAVEKLRKERRQKRAAEARNAKPPQTASEAAFRMAAKTGLDKKINQAALDKLFGEPESKKSRTDDNKAEEFQPEDGNEDDSKMGNDNEYQEDVGKGDFTEGYDGDDLCNGNVEDKYNYHGDYDGFVEEY